MSRSLPRRVVGGLLNRPLAAAIVSLAVFTAVFFPLRARLGDGAFIICNLLPLVFGALFGMGWGILFATLHTVYGLALAGLAGVGFDRFLSNGLPATVVTIALSGITGRIRDLTLRLRHELEERQRAEGELRRNRTALELLVDQRTHDLRASNDQLRREMAERERAEAEKQQLEASLKRAEKMEAIGVLAGSVAHDLNNLLSGVIAYPELMLLELPEGSPLREPLCAIRESGERAAAIVEDLLTMARRGLTTRQVLNLNHVISDLMRSPELKRLLVSHPNVCLESELEPRLLDIQGSSIHLAKAIVNLVRNAMEALEKGGRVRLSTKNVYVDTPETGYEVLAEGEYVTLAVEDTGEGIPEEDLDRIFEPFYSRKKLGRSGTGLGMAIVWGTVKDHGGFIDVRSQVGKGTTFTVFLPATREPHRADTPGVALAEHLGEGESILVVDDVALQRELCTAMLRKLHYQVTTASSGEEAVELVRSRRFHLLILDMIMEPGIDGLETYRRVVEVAPGQRALIASGYSETVLVRKAQELGAGAYVKKPYTLEKLAVAVRNELGRDGADPSDYHERDASDSGH
jgi:signal transduction histidine kinase/ActR/RegA family two-component response regulator